VRRVGVRDFRDHATKYLAGDEVLAIERHGTPIGFYIPTCLTRQESLAQALARLQEAVEHIRTETGLSEEELSRLYDVNEPLPSPLKAHLSDTDSSDASRR
jgi:NADH:ubiquinone oxidoreductase subunit B-like Fe-S oxidoreductase